MDSYYILNKEASFNDGTVKIHDLCKSYGDIQAVIRSAYPLKVEKYLDYLVLMEQEKVQP